jgi:hypothetical protein
VKSDDPPCARPSCVDLREARWIVPHRASVHNGGMTLDDFKKSSGNPNPPDGVSPALAALWHDAHGDWDAAHRVAQEIKDPTGAWVHAYLHRKEGDLGNARYWYARAGQPESRESLEKEWESIVSILLRR